MTMLHRESLPVNRDRTDVEADPRSWPAWTDEDRWEPGPDPEEAAWAAESFGEDASDYDVEDLDELAALEAAATDALSLGLIPNDVVEGIARTSLVGLRDELTTSYGPVER